MKLILKKSPSGKKEVVVTIGMFDGLHLGHQFIIKKLISRARKRGVSSAVVTFWPHPEQVLGRKFAGHIIDAHQKMRMLSSLGIDYVWVLKSTVSLLKMEGSKFIEKLCSRLKIVEVVVGQDFKFGYRRRYNVNTLKKLSYRFGFNLTTVKKKKLKGRIISSSFIRGLIKKADFKGASASLGRSFILELPVVKGRGKGKELGYPTANLDYDCFVIPQAGVYAVYAGIGGKTYPGAAYIGCRPTFGGKKLSFEVHLIGFKGNIVNRKIRVIFLAKVGDEEKFSSPGELARRIEKYIAHITARYSPSRSISTQLIVP